ncbi:MAG: hypothetical protein DMG32_20745 [Acidobacteria bacterium]|nr:MAG: hypothetical protein DMG32_20745 [Acidobacteriota bacterium]
MHPAGQRRSSRISKAISIMLSGSDIEGKQFSEETKTLVLSPNDIELDVYAINHSILRHCKQCGTSTPWKEAGGDADTKSPSIPAQKEPEPEAMPVPAVRPENRRKDVRAKVNFSACIRHSGFQEIVVCENVSRGGFCFKSRKRYAEKSMIQVAIPYSPGAPGIFVQAQIAHVQELPAEKLFRCGAAYVKS